MGCANNPACAAALDAAATAAGLPPGSVASSIKTYKNIGGYFTGQRGREEFRTNVFAPNGYRICDVRVNMISAAPMHSNRSPTFAATIQSDKHFELYSFVHRQGIFNGRSFVDAVATVQFAKIGSPAERACYAKPKGIYQYRCNQQNYQGMPLCGNVPFGSLPRTR